MKTLNTINIGKSAVIQSVLTEEAMRRRLLDIGMTEGTTIECVGRSPCGDPRAYLIRGAVIAIRNDDARKVMVKWG